MTNTVILKPIKDSTTKPDGKPPPINKRLWVDPSIHFYEIEDGDNNEEGEEAEILVIHYSSLTVSKQDLVKRKFPWINPFDHEIPDVINAMHNITVGVFKHLEIASKIYPDQRVNYTERILRVLALHCFQQFLLACKEEYRGLDENVWTLRAAKIVTMEQSWVWDKVGGVYSDGVQFTGAERCAGFEK